MLCAIAFRKRPLQAYVSTRDRLKIISLALAVGEIEYEERQSLGVVFIRNPASVVRETCVCTLKERHIRSNITPTRPVRFKRRCRMQTPFLYNERKSKSKCWKLNGFSFGSQLKAVVFTKPIIILRGIIPTSRLSLDTFCSCWGMANVLNMARLMAYFAAVF